MARLTDSPNLDVLRAFAVLAVAASHLYGFFWAFPQFATFAHNLGVGGVCFFFVHTSLVLFSSMNRMKATNLARAFFIRRGFRIYPLCWLCIILVLTTGWTEVSRGGPVEMGWPAILANIALVQNITHSGSVVGPLWSLPWEVQMYLVLPALFLLMKKSGRPLLLALALWLSVTTLAIAVTTFRVPSIFHAAIYPPMFLGGMIAFQLSSGIRSRISSLLWPLFVLSLLVGRCWLLQGGSIELPHNVAVNATICLLLGLAIPLFKNIRNPMLANSAHQIAKYSYGIYLFHVPALVLVSRHLESIPIVFKVVACVAITGAASIGAYHLVEYPMIKLGKRVAERFEGLPRPSLEFAE